MVELESIDRSGFWDEPGLVGGMMALGDGWKITRQVKKEGSRVPIMYIYSDIYL